MDGSAAVVEDSAYAGWAILVFFLLPVVGGGLGYLWSKTRWSRCDADGIPKRKDQR